MFPGDTNYGRCVHHILVSPRNLQHFFIYSFYSFFVAFFFVFAACIYIFCCVFCIYSTSHYLVVFVFTAHFCILVVFSCFCWAFLYLVMLSEFAAHLSIWLCFLFFEACNGIWLFLLIFQHISVFYFLSWFCNTFLYMVVFLFLQRELNWRGFLHLLVFFLFACFLHMEYEIWSMKYVLTVHVQMI